MYAANSHQCNSDGTPYQYPPVGYVKPQASARLCLGECLGQHLDPPGGVVLSNPQDRCQGCPSVSDKAGVRFRVHLSSFLSGVRAARARNVRVIAPPMATACRACTSSTVCAERAERIRPTLPSVPARHTP